MKKTLSLVLGLMMVLALAVPAMAAPVEIEYWSVFTGADGATMQGMVDAFNASQSDVKVNHTPMTADDLYQKLPLAVQTAQGVPDVAIVHIERIPMFVKQEMIWAGVSACARARRSMSAKNARCCTWPCAARLAMIFRWTASR